MYVVGEKVVRVKYTRDEICVYYVGEGMKKVQT